jgi:hypothetical protein
LQKKKKRKTTSGSVYVETYPESDICSQKFAEVKPNKDKDNFDGMRRNNN